MSNLPSAITSRLPLFATNTLIQNLFPELTIEEMASIHAYSQNQFDKLNRRLRGEDFNTPLNEILDSIAQLLEAALQKCNSKFNGTVYRGTRLPEQTIQEHYQAYKNKKPVVYPEFLSTTKSMGKEFSGNAKYTITCKNGAFIEPLTLFKSIEEEVLINKGTSFIVDDIYEIAGITYIKMTQQD